MYKSKLYLILQHFDKYEQNRCRKYLQSPYFNRSQELMQLYEALTAEVNGNVRGKLDKEQLWADLQPGKVYDDVRFRKYCSDLLKLVEGYLAQEVYEQSPIEQATHLMQAIKKRKISALASTALRATKRLSNQQSFKNAQYFLNQYKIEQNLYDITEFETKRSDRTNIEAIADNLDAFFLAEKLRILCAAITQQVFVKHSYQFKLNEEIVAHLKARDYEAYPPVATYYQIYLTLSEPEEEDHYFKLKELLDKYSHLFPPKEAKEVLYMAAQNYWIRKLNQGNQRAVEELFFLYRDMINRKIIFEDGELSPWYFKNIVVIGLRRGEYQWTENFIKDYARNLPDSFRENAVTYNLAQVYFYQKKYEKVIELLREVEYEDIAYNLNSKTILIATYYETDEIEPLYSLFESFRTYLNRHRDIPEQRRKLYSNLIKFTKKLTRIMPGDRAAVAKLKQEIEETKNVASHNWLKEKLAELES